MKKYDPFLAFYRENKRTDLESQLVAEGQGSDLAIDVFCVALYSNWTEQSLCQ